MILPTLAELKQSFVSFVVHEQLTWRTLFHPRKMFGIFVRYRFLHFLIIGGAGAALGLGVTWALTTFVFGLENYFTAYLIGTAVSLVFNFTLYSVLLFKTSRDHLQRLAVFFVYIISMIVLQAMAVKTITPIVGLRFYLLVIAGVILLFSFINFLVFRLSIFKERPAE